MSQLETNQFRAELFSCLEQQGFPIFGGVDFDSVDYAPFAKRYTEWLEAGYSGTMTYLQRGKRKRTRPELNLKDLKSVVCVGLPYSSKPAGDSKPGGVRYARYIAGTDYHSEIPMRIERAVRSLVEKHQLDLTYKVGSDHSQLIERTWAALSGLGWIGKNSMLIHPKLGSYFLIGTLLLDRPIGLAPNPLPDYCGSCTRCLSSCPTDAITSQRQVNSNKCISYLTLEYRGDALPTEVEAERLRGPNWVAGCDICQEVCPFNLRVTKAEAEGRPLFDLAHEALPRDLDPTHLASLADLKRETVAEYSSRASHTALSRIAPEQFKRNLDWLCSPETTSEG